MVALRPATLLGAVSAACLVLLVVTGVVLACFFDPSGESVTYDGSYALLRGVPVSEAYASVLHLSFEVRGGLLVRQVHHWAALVLPGTLMLQLLVTFFGGAFRRPRRLAWFLLCSALLAVLGAGWSGYGLPDDLLSGTGLRIFEGILIGLPVVGTRATAVVFGGEYPGQVVEHLYWAHVAVFPALAVAALVARAVVVARLPPLRAARGRRPARRVPLRVAALLLSGLGVVTAGWLVLLAGLVTINPVWVYGPASAGHASAGSQPDWYTGFLDGAVRLAPSGWELSAHGHTLPLGVLLPQLLVGGLLAAVVCWPFLEALVTRDRRRGEALERPRDHPVRTSLGAAGLTVYLTLLVAGATDWFTLQLGVAFEWQVHALRVWLVVGPVVVFQATRLVCLGLTAREQEVAEHGVETGVLVRRPDGGYEELTGPRPGRGRDERG